MHKPPIKFYNIKKSLKKIRSLKNKSAGKNLTANFSLKIFVNKVKSSFQKSFIFVKKMITLKLFIFLFALSNLYLIFLIFNIILQINKNTLYDRNKNLYKASNYPSLLKKSYPDISAKAALVYDKKSRIAVFKKNDVLRFSPASSVKIMTALVVLENYNLDDILTVKNLDGVEGSKMNLVMGEKISVQNLLYGLLLPSGNDAAHVLALHFNGGTSAFVSKMNEKANSLMMHQTLFKDPSGYDDGNYTTADDLVRLASNAIDNKVFAQIVNTKSKTVTDESRRIIHNLENLNELLGHDGVNGVKTGFTNESGGILVTSLDYKGRTIIIDVLKSGDRFADTREIISKVVKNIDYKEY